MNQPQDVEKIIPSVNVSVIAILYSKSMNREAIRMEMNHLYLEYIWNQRKDEMKRAADFKETYKLYPDFTNLKIVINTNR